ncbi:MAG: phytanoyl-CoA dioxygenase family protein [Aquihabitans sp.]
MGVEQDRAVDVSAYERDGYLVVPGLFSASETAHLLAALEDSIEPDEANDLTLGAMQFTSNAYRRSAEVRRFLVDPRILGLVTALTGPDAWCRWDQAVCKGPGSATFPWHQDNGYTQLPHEHLQIWVALTPADEDRGGLLVEPGAHRVHREHRWVGSHVEVIDPPVSVAVIDAHPGDVVAFSSLLPHATTPNTTSEDRWAYVAEFLPLAAGDPSVDRPHYVVLRDGAPVGRFET